MNGKSVGPMICALVAAGVSVANASVTLSKSEDIAKLIPQETDAQRWERMSWWTDSRFGMFLHFGIYSLAARHEKVILHEVQSDEKYRRYFDNFNPDLFDARKWAKQAKACGMRYAVLTAKHHDGFCLFDSKFTDYKSTNTAFGRDIVREYADAFRAEGLKVGLYYSLIDWHHPDFTFDACHPRWKEYGKEKCQELNKGKDWNAYRQYMKNQVTELLTNYGDISIIWFDFSYPGPDGKGRDDWDSPALLALARKLQPGIIVDNRMDMNDVPCGCDFVTPEQLKANVWPELNGRRYPWEACYTFSGSWGYHRGEATWKSVYQCLDLLIGAVAHGGNLMLNVGPTGRGTFDYRATDRLKGIADWMELNGRSIHGCTEAPSWVPPMPGTELTYNPKTNRLYIHLLQYPSGPLGMKFAAKVAYSQFLHDASEVRLEPLPAWQRKGDPNGYDAYFKLPIVKPPVEIPVIEVMLGAGCVENGANDNQS